jgi:hypothetical protein
MHYVNEKIDTNMLFGVDYFNQRVFGWEPLVEPWSIKQLLWQWNAHTNSLKVQPGKIFIVSLALYTSISLI